MPPIPRRTAPAPKRGQCFPGEMAQLYRGTALAAVYSRRRIRPPSDPAAPGPDQPVCKSLINKRLSAVRKAGHNGASGLLRLLHQTAPGDAGHDGELVFLCEGPDALRLMRDIPLVDHQTAQENSRTAEQMFPAAYKDMSSPLVTTSTTSA